MSRVLVKICGFTRASDVEAAVLSGVDAVGFVFAASPRRIAIETAVHLSSCVPKGVLCVGLFQNQDQSEIEKVLNSVTLDVLQFHGDEPQQQCDVFNIPWLKAVAMDNSASLQQAERDYPAALGLLLDSHSVGQQGGTGKVFDWSLCAPVSKPVWLAGGLTAENVSRAVRTVSPYAVDVSSGVEQSPGIKDAEKMSAFMQTVRELDYEHIGDQL
jgi:phosphoribosylanthranilate isomerase